MLKNPGVVDLVDDEVPPIHPNLLVRRRWLPDTAPT